MVKTYQLKALWPLLQFETAAAPLLATLDAYGGGLVKYAVSQDGFWLFSQSQPFSASESEGLTGFHPADLVPKRIDGVDGYFYGMQDGAPLLPLPFTAAQLIEFDRRTAGLVVASIERGNDTEGWIAELGKNNPDAAELARGIHGGKWPVDLADLVDTKTDNAPKPRFHLAGGIVPSASAKAAKSVFDEVQRQQDAIRLMGISPDLLKEIDRQKDMEKLVGGGASRLADATYLQDLKRNQDLLRAINPSASEIAAEALGRQLSTVGPGADIYLQSQSMLQKEIEKAAGVGIGTVGEIMRQHEREGLDALQRHINPSAHDIFEKVEREGIEKALTNAERRETVIEFTPPPFYDHQATINRQRERDREHAIETARLAEIARLEARDEYAARKQAAPSPAAPVGVETQEARQKRRYDLCIAAGLQMPSDDYSHLPTGIGALARAENISTAAFSKDVKAYIASRR